MPVDGRIVDMTDEIVRTYRKHGLDALLCIGGGGTQKNALRLVQAGLNVVTLPKTIDNDVAETDATIGFATALEIATDAIDRLHSTAHSHHRIIVAEVMGHQAGWLALGAGIAGGADVVLIPEIPYHIDSVVRAIKRRTRNGTNFSIVAIAEGARDQAGASAYDDLIARRVDARGEADKRSADAAIAAFDARPHRARPSVRASAGGAHRARITGHDPGLRPAWRHAVTGRSSACGSARECGCGSRGGRQVRGHGRRDGDGTGRSHSTSSPDGARPSRVDHPWIDTARHVGTCLGD